MPYTAVSATRSPVPPQRMLLYPPTLLSGRTRHMVLSALLRKFSYRPSAYGDTSPPCSLSLSPPTSAPPSPSSATPSPAPMLL
eukprot:3546681-Rhodomonas_salina.1